MTVSCRSPFLVLISEPRPRSIVVEALEALRSVVAPPNGAEAKRAVDGRFCGAILLAPFEGEPAALVIDGLGLRARAIPTLVVDPESAPTQVVSAWDRGARVVPREAALARIRRFARDCVIAENVGDDRLARALSLFVDEHAVTASELELVEGALRGRRAAWFKEHRAIPIPTYKSRVHALLERSGVASMEDLVRGLFWTALGGTESPLDPAAASAD
jgi:hypothetical protein